MRPRPRAVPGTGCRPGGGVGRRSCAARHSRTAGRRAPSSDRAGPASRRYPLRQPTPKHAELVADGTVIIIGGAEDKVRDRVILSRFVALAGGVDATIAVICTASSLGLEAGERYRAVFGELGRHAGPPAPRGHPAAGQRRDRGPRGPRRDRRSS